jgi:hypothetical protein
MAPVLLTVATTLGRPAELTAVTNAAASVPLIVTVTVELNVVEFAVLVVTVN